VIGLCPDRCQSLLSFFTSPAFLIVLFTHVSGTQSYKHTILPACACACLLLQAPLQNRAPGWTLGSKGCYDEATLQQLQQTLAADLGSIADGNASGCLSLLVPDDVLSVLRQETLR
jgi:hypothetical protein